MPTRKTITVTHLNAMNYGAVLQAYALQQQLFKLGIDDEILDLEVNHKVFNKVKFNKHLAGNVYNNMLSLLHIRQTKKRAKRFRDFIDYNIRTTRHYGTVEEVIKSPPIADAYITGSDQMFNTYWGVKPCHFLKFGSEETHRISYASSMGRPAVEEKYLDEFVSAIKKYDFLSVREKSDADYISKLCSVACSMNLDPSLLLSKDEWSELASNSMSRQRSRPDKYILVYQLLENPLLNYAVKKIKRETGLNVLVINPYSHCLVKGDLIIRDAGPTEFLELFKNAEYILTTSFHGTCFSILFQKRFFSFIRTSGETRINNILNMLNLSNRIITDLSQLVLNEILYDDVNAIVQSERAKSCEYLIKALGV